MTTLKSQAEAKLQLEQAEKVKQRAARQAAKRILDPATVEMVECVVLPSGDSKISMGEHVPPYGTAHYEEGDTFTVELSIALSLYNRGYVNFDGAREKAKAAAEAALHAERMSMAEDIALRRMIEQAEARLG